ncbi:flagellar basal-body rod protein FlgF [Massilia glaciei]|uniref:Flagellar basal-body rod protein FlgF n=1 Tax=Massilia glaciei TaxID=1524097 RepID=A0A2U2HGP7_9BURK|nr:flagellar basal-body rod protein FlgF [Massilia glaciei]PWF44352.1 flagellar basal-body rod protein FlgF [Massilia glaciei]
MDRLIYTAASGAKHLLDQQATTANNLANVGTTGFRAQIDAFRAVPVVGGALPTRTFVVGATVGSDFSAGPLQMTGRALDVAVSGKGWIALQMPDGSEAYTRNGALQMNANGMLQSNAGFAVQGDGGTITVPPEVTVEVASDGTVSTMATSNTPGAPTVLGRLKLVNPDEANLVRGDDGLFRLRDGSAAAADPLVKVVGGALEGSNVSPVDSMVSMITLARAFETQMSLLKNAENNAAKATQILALS